MPPVLQSGSVSHAPARTIWWEGDAPDAATAVIDQRRLPHELVVDRWTSLDDVVAGIADMEVRGAPLIGVAAAHGMALSARADPGMAHLKAAAKHLGATRPTAVNLQWALTRCLDAVGDQPASQRASRLMTVARQLADDDVAQCRAIGETGLELLSRRHEQTGRVVNVLTHCNAGRLACVELGTATAAVYLAASAGVAVHVGVSETRPRNQGAALTAWELGEAGVDHTLVVDNAAGHLMASGLVDMVIVGADRVAANGDTANKIGTALKAYAAAAFGVPFYVAVPWPSFDARCPDGAAIPIEERDPDEVLVVNGSRVAPGGTPARNWGFDVTAARWITGFLTPSGLVSPEGLRALWRRR